MTQIFLDDYCSCNVLLLDVSISFPQHLHLHRAVYVFFSVFFIAACFFRIPLLKSHYFLKHNTLHISEIKVKI